MSLSQQDWRKNVLGNLSSSEVQLLNKADRIKLEEDTLYWECADCLAAAVTINSSIIQQSATHYAYVAVDGTFGRGAVFVDYKDTEKMSHNIIIVRSIDVDTCKMMLLSGIGGIPPE